MVFVALCFTTLFPLALALTCPPGSFVCDDGVCRQCPANTISTTSNATDCTLCAPPLAATPGSIACLPCGTGKYFSPNQDKRCRLCPSGTYNDLESALSCKPCPSGSVTPLISTSIASCTFCRPGFRAQVFRYTVECTRCEPGYATNPANPTACLPCPAGTFIPRVGARGKDGPAECRPCHPGAFGTKTAAESCEKCPMGTFQDELGKTSCKTCPEGSITRHDGARQCRPTCKPGDWWCFYCKPGNGVNPITGNCEECPTGTVGQIRTVTPCFPCPPPEGVPNENRTKCVCAEGGRLRKVDGTCESLS